MDATPALERLRAALLPLTAGGIALAYSGGVDSSLLLAVLAALRADAPFPLLALTMRSPFAPWGAAAPAGVPQEVVDFDALSEPRLRGNPPDRCYVCKRAFIGRFADVARARGLATLMDGTNADDLREHRPGLRALRELGVRSPLAELGLTKVDVRAMAKALRLPCADAPASPCLATRFPHGTELTAPALRAVAEGEAFLRRFLPPSAALRLRVHGDLARIEAPPETLPALLAAREELLERLTALGFRRVTLDLAGYTLSH